MEYHKGDVVLVNFPYLPADQKVAVKKRPALIVQDDLIDNGDDIVLIAISSRGRNIQRVFPLDILLEEQTAEWKATGLRITSIIRCGTVATIPKQAVTHKLGTLPDNKLREVEKKLKILFKLS